MSGVTKLLSAKWLLVALTIPALFVIVRARAEAGDAVSPAAAASSIKRTKDLQLIDVRTAGEFADGHLEGAKLIPVQDLESRVSEIDKGKPVLLYCRTGRRSAEALRILDAHGLKGAKHLDGGIRAWQAAGLPVTR